MQEWPGSPWWPCCSRWSARIYYLRVVKLMYFDEPKDKLALQASGALRTVLSVNGLAVLLLGVFPGLLLALCARVLP